MSCGLDFKEWMYELRLSRKVCMMIPMEACMGHPIAVKQGAEYILPFFKTLSVESTDYISPPFAYLRVAYPSAVVLTYNNLRTLPNWYELDWNITAKKITDGDADSKLEAYYKAIVGKTNQPQGIGECDSMLLECLRVAYPDGGRGTVKYWYKKLIDEAKKYR